MTDPGQKSKLDDSGNPELDPESIDVQLKAAQIEHYRAEAANWKKDLEWRRGWRSFVKPIVAGLTIALALWGYFEFMFKTTLDNQIQLRDYYKEQANQQEQQLNSINANILAQQSVLARQEEENDSLEKRNDLLDEKLQELEESLAEAQTRLTSRDQTETQLKETIANLESQISDTRNTAKIALDAENRHKERMGLLRTFFVEKIAELDVNGFRLAEHTKPEWLAEYRARAQLADDKKIVAVMDGIFKDAILFTNDGIWSNTENSQYISYEAFLQSNIVRTGYTLLIGENFELSVSGISMRTSTMIALLEELKSFIAGNTEASSEREN